MMLLHKKVDLSNVIVASDYEIITFGLRTMRQPNFIRKLLGVANQCLVLLTSPYPEPPLLNCNILPPSWCSRLYHVYMNDSRNILSYEKHQIALWT